MFILWSGPLRYYQQKKKPKRSVACGLTLTFKLIAGDGRKKFPIMFEEQSEISAVWSKQITVFLKRNAQLIYHFLCPLPLIHGTCTNYSNPLAFITNNLVLTVVHVQNCYTYW